MTRSAFVAAIAVVSTFGSSPPPLAAAEPLSFRVSYDKAALAGPFTGRVFVVLLRGEPRPVPKQLNWFNPEPAFAKDVTGWKPGDPLAVGADAVATTPLAKLKPGKYWVQAVMDRDLGGISFAASDGNLYSKAVQMSLDPAESGAVDLKLDQVYREPAFAESEQVKYAELVSDRLTRFHGKPTKMRAGVILPPSWGKEPDRKYPVVFEITGFGGDHNAARGMAGRKPWDVAGEEMIWVVLDANCRLGHHVFADSANNGPVGTALVEEFIPYIEQKFRVVGKPAARFVTGHSSGGWSSLWVQVTYPDTFGGCWSTSPDPVDFRDFQRLDLNKPGANLFTEAGGKKRPLARVGGEERMHFKPFSDMEVVMGRGGQLFSFEAVFSPRGADGRPQQLWDRSTGAIDPATAKAWEKYDIRKTLENNWATLGPKLAGKLHVYMGDEDTFYLDGAARLLKESLAKLKSDAVVEMFPGKSHALVDANLRKRMNAEMAAAYRKGTGAKPKAVPLDKGINLGNALDAPKEGEWGLTLEAGYFAAIKEAGFRTVRIPVRWSAHAAKAAPYTIEPKFFERIDWALDQAAKNDLTVVLNVHHYGEMDSDPDAHLPRLIALWEQIAGRYKDRPASVVFELLNEPHDKLTEARWNDALPAVLKAVRATNPTRAAVVGPGQWNGIRALPKLKLPDDPNLIVTVHYYNPFEFTHQGAEWSKGSEKWLGRKWGGTPAEVAAVRKDFDAAAAWAKANGGRPVFLGEFGAYQKADMESRAAWTRAVVREAEARGWGWAYWEFASGFGAYDKQAKAWKEPLRKALLKD